MKKEELIELLRTGESNGTLGVFESRRVFGLLANVLERVVGLPEKWDADSEGVHNAGEWCGINICAGELREALEEIETTAFPQS